MWIVIIIIACVIGAIIAMASDGSPLEGCLVGGFFAGSCLLRIFLAVVGILILFWLFGVLF